MVVDFLRYAGYYAGCFLFGSVEITYKNRKGIISSVRETEISHIIVCRQLAVAVSVAASGLVGEQYVLAGRKRRPEAVLSCRDSCKGLTYRIQGIPADKVGGEKLLYQNCR